MSSSLGGALERGRLVQLVVQLVEICLNDSTSSDDLRARTGTPLVWVIIDHGDIM